MRGFPQIVGIPPDVLMQQHRLADVWLTNTWEELVNLGGISQHTDVLCVLGAHMKDS